MSEIGIAVSGIVGLLLGSLAWTAAAVQMALSEPISGKNSIPTTPPGWLPLWGFGFDRSGESVGTRRTSARAIFEVAVALYSAVVAARAAERLDLLVIGLFAVPLLVVLLVDWWTRTIFTNWIAAGMVLALVVAAFDGVRSLVEAFAGLATGAAVFGGFYVVSLLLYRDVRVVSLGAGDVALAAMIGAMTGDALAAVGTLFYGIVLAALGAGVLLIVRRGSQAKALPSGSYLCAGALIGLALQVW